jgi:hypothetical protein
METIAGAGPLAAAVAASKLSRPFVFGPSDMDPELLEQLEYGGVTYQDVSDLELVQRINRANLNNEDASVLLYDPYASRGDLRYLRDLPKNLVETKQGNYFIKSASKLLPYDITDFRSYCVGYQKILYVLNIYVDPLKLDSTLNTTQFSFDFIRECYVNCYDDESWMGVTVE